MVSLVVKGVAALELLLTISKLPSAFLTNHVQLERDLPTQDFCERFFEGVERAPLGVDCVCQFATWLPPTVGFQNHSSRKCDLPQICAALLNTAAGEDFARFLQILRC